MTLVQAKAFRNEASWYACVTPGCYLMWLVDTTGLGRDDGGRTPITEDFVCEKAQGNQISSILTQIRELSWHQDLLVIQRIQLIMRHM